MRLPLRQIKPSNRILSKKQIARFDIYIRDEEGRYPLTREAMMCNETPCNSHRYPID